MVTAKISSAFRSRLESQSPTDVVRAVLVFDLSSLTDAINTPHVPGRRTAAQRRAKVKRLSEVAPALNDRVNQLLNRYHARRMSEKLTSLGTLLVEAPASEFFLLEDEPLIRAVLDDQAVIAPATEHE